MSPPHQPTKILETLWWPTCNTSTAHQGAVQVGNHCVTLLTGKKTNKQKRLYGTNKMYSNYFFPPTFLLFSPVNNNTIDGVTIETSGVS